MKVHHHILLILVVVLVGGWFLWPQTTIQEPDDELTGTWRAVASAESEYQWWMEYEFENGQYTLTTDSYYTEEGTYAITERFLDGSILIKKIYANGEKEYDMAIMTTDDPNVISIEGTNLFRQ